MNYIIKYCKKEIYANFTFALRKKWYIMIAVVKRISFGWVAERSNATVLKTADGATRPGVRIPHHPP